ncbi:unnamed protein product [Adineta steineri]|uniref:Uncharacterized protein n=1 Tax=Adineta steineri TaxID=433720 RepID=A0A819MSF7_9BILA|nr:unnamed protein product [Adineta steineri]CAF3984569.1 unnamed protein product [Adineta steineri]
MVKLNEVSPIDYNNTSVRDPQSTSINIDQTSITQSQTLWEQIRTKKWMRIVLLILRSGDAEKTLSTEATTMITTETTTMVTTTTTTSMITIEITTTTGTTTTTTTTTTSGSCLIYYELASFNSATILLNSILSADVNEDDKLDIIVGNRLEKTIMIFLNLDDGTFTQSKIFLHEIVLSRITTGDINNDGKLDLIATSSDVPDITIFYNTGNGNFNNTMIIPTENIVFDVKAVDINKDNKLDLIVTDSYNNYIFVFMNDGNGVFSKQITYETTYFPHKLEVIDVNNDALSDIIVTHDVKKMTVFLNTDNGNFIEQKPSLLGLKLGFIKAIDINGDNEIDLIVGSGRDLHIHFGFGNSTFADPITYSIVDGLDYLETADFNNDNKTDIILSHSGSYKISIFFNTGNGTFKEPKILDNINHPKYAAMIDIDGKAELVVANDETMRILHLRC